MRRLLTVLLVIVFWSLVQLPVKGQTFLDDPWKEDVTYPSAATQAFLGAIGSPVWIDENERLPLIGWFYTAEVDEIQEMRQKPQPQQPGGFGHWELWGMATEGEEAVGHNPRLALRRNEEARARAQQWGMKIGREMTKVTRPGTDFPPDQYWLGRGVMFVWVAEKEPTNIIVQSGEKPFHFRTGLGFRSLITGEYNFTSPTIEVSFLSSKEWVGLTLYGGGTPWTASPLDVFGPRRDLLVGLELSVKPVLPFMRITGGYAYGAESFVKRDIKVPSGQLRRTGAFSDGFYSGLQFYFKVGRWNFSGSGAWLWNSDLSTLNNDGRTYFNRGTDAFLINVKVEFEF